MMVISVKQASRLSSKLSSDPNLHFIIRETDLERALEHPDHRALEMVLKTATLYASKGIILTKPVTHYKTPGYSDPNYHNYWGKGEISTKLKTFYNKHARVQSFNKLFHFLPERIEESIEEWIDENEWITATPNVMFDFSTAYNNCWGIGLSFSDPTLNAHIFGTLQCKHDELSVVNIWLPQLSNVPFDVLLKIRADEYSSFKRFQFVLRRLITDTENVSSERKLTELFKYVDYEVRRFDSKMNQLKKTRALRSYQAAVGVSIMGLCLVTPTEIGKMIMSFIGGYELREFMGALFHYHEKVNDMKASDFYVPWLCTTKKAKNK